MVIPYPTELIAAVILPVLFAVTGAVFAGDALKTWYPTLKQPRFALPIPIFMMVGGLYAILCGLLLYRLWTAVDDTPLRTLALVLLSLMMGANEVWNYLLFGLKHFTISLIGMIGFALLVAALWVVLLSLDGLAALLLTPYLLWMIYDVAWIHALWRLNPVPAVA